ncbi:MAG: LamG-like jellyroll fold domain-containing protein [bacterium]
MKYISILSTLILIALALYLLIFFIFPNFEFIVIKNGQCENKSLSISKKDKKIISNNKTYSSMEIGLRDYETQPEEVMEQEDRAQKEEQFNQSDDHIELSNKKKDTTLLDSLVTYYSFNQNAQDLSGNKNNGNIYGATWVPQGKSGGAYEFDGIDDYICSKESIPITGTMSRTLSLWFKTSIASHEQKIVHLGTSEGSTRASAGFAFSLWINPSNKLIFRGNQCNFDTGVEVFHNTWHHVAATYDGENVSVFLDGKFIKSEAKYLSTKGNPLYIGTDDRGSKYLGRAYFCGIMDEVALFDYALSEDEIHQIYNEGILPAENNSDTIQQKVNDPNRYAQSESKPSRIKSEEIFIVNKNGEYKVLFIDGTIPLKENVLLHIPGSKCILAEIKRHGKDNIWRNRQLHIQIYGVAQPKYLPMDNPASYIIATTAASNALGSNITEISQQLPVLGLISPQCAEEIYATVRNYTKEKIKKERKLVLDQIPFEETAAFRLFKLPHEKFLIIIALRIIYLRDIEGIPRNWDMYDTPYYGHEIVGFSIAKENKIEGELISFLSLTDIDRDVSKEFRDSEPKEALDKTIYGVYDLEPDGVLEILMNEWDTTQNLKMKRLINGNHLLCVKGCETSKNSTKDKQ